MHLLPERGFIIIASMLLFSGCATLPVRDSTIQNNSLTIFQVKSTGSFIHPLGLYFFTDEPIRLILKDFHLGTEYTGELLYKKYCFFPNLPVGEYVIEKAETVLSKPVIGTPVFLFFNEYSKKIIITNSNVNYFASYHIKTKQYKYDLNVQAIDEVLPKDNEIEELKKYINEKNVKSGWRY